MSWEPLGRLGAHVAEQQDALLERAPADAETRQQLERQVLERSRRSLARRGRFLVATRWLAPALLLLCAWLGRRWIHTPDAPLTFTVGARPGALQAWESAPSDAALPLSFSDGSSFRLEPQARARVASITAHGAEVVLESGRAQVHVAPHQRQPAHYLVRSGPFAVEVKGTRFDLDWDPANEEFSLRLYEGRVSVTGCGFGPGREVPAGYRVSASCRRPGLELEAIAEASEASVAPASADTARAQASEPKTIAPALVPQIATPPLDGPAPSQAARRSAPPLSWQQLARSGRFQQAYEVARASGFELECARAQVEDVVLLGDAARHAGHAIQARQAYSRVRERAPASAAAASAAFALGRLSLDDDPGEAAEWFERSLSERPRGALAQAARDRLLEAAVQQGDPQHLREVAERYLDQSPAGPHAEQARAILQRGESKR